MRDQALIFRVLSVIGGLVLGGLIAWTSTQGRRLLAFLRESWQETRRVVWPTKKETWSVTLYVFLFVVVMAIFLWLVDSGLQFVLYVSCWAGVADEQTLVCGARLLGHGEEASAVPFVSASSVRACRISSARFSSPPEEVVEMKNGQRSITERRFFPGYVLVEMEMNDDTWHLVKNTNKVTGFVGGSGNRPAAISQAEVDKIMNQMAEGVEKPRPKTLFEIGEMVRVKEGPFADFNGNVEEVNYEKSRLTVSVTIFGRATPVELEFGQVEKL